MLIKKVDRTIEKYKMILPGERVLVAVSGGVDSVCTLYILHKLRKKYNMELGVAHLNHGLRGEEAERDLQFVRTISENYGIPFFSGFRDVREYSKRKKLSIEEAARILRYRFLTEIADSEGYKKIALGHNADDQAETVLMHLITGTSPFGLKGMAPVRDERFIRPLIEVKRDAIVDFAKKEGLQWVYDSSNEDISFLRNRIRRTLIPFLKENFNRNIIESLLHLSEQMREEDEYLELISEKLFLDSLTELKEGSLRMDTGILKNLPPYMVGRVMRHAIKRIAGKIPRMSRRNFEDIWKLINGKRPGAFIMVPGDVYVERQYENLIMGKGFAEEIEPYEMSFEVPGRIDIMQAGCMIEAWICDRNSLRMEFSPDRAYMDCEKLTFPFTVRNFRPGDRFHPFGSSGEKKLKKFFIDLKIPRAERKKIPLVISGDEIVWVSGYRISEKVRITENTKRVLVMHLTKFDNIPEEVRL